MADSGTASGHVCLARFGPHDSLGLSDHIEFAGMIPHEQIDQNIRQHHAMVMPSRRESFGVAALEAGASGRAVIASAVGGIPVEVAGSIGG